MAALMQMMQKRAVVSKQKRSQEDKRIPSADRGKALPLSFSQQRLWFIEKLDPNAGSAYHISGAVRLTGPLDEVVLVYALDTIVKRHEVLRTHFSADSEQPVQQIAPADCGMPFERIKLNDASQLTITLDALKQRPFDLSHGRLIRSALISTDKNELVLFLCLHHAIADGWSLGLLLKELSVLYRAQTLGTNEALLPLECQYADYSVWQREWLTSEQAKRQNDYWVRTLSGAPELLALPTDFPRPEKQDYAGGRVAVQFDAAFSKQLHQFSQCHGMTDYMVMLAAWSSLLARLSGQDEVVIGSPVANRSRRETEALIGFFANTLALRVDHAGQPTVAEFLSRVKAQNIAAQSNQDLPFDQVVENVQPNRSLAYTPLFQVMFAWSDSSADELQLGNVQASVMELEDDETSAQFDLSLSLGWHHHQIEGDIRFARALFRKDTIETYLQCWQQLLHAWMENDQQLVDQVPLLNARQMKRVTQDFNKDKRTYPITECIHQRFETQVARYPEQVAVTYQDCTLTYAQLNAQANQLAHWLIEQGVGPDSRVAIALERSEVLPVALLATLKAGGAYVPLDPNYPQERLEYSLADSQPEVVITTTDLISRLGRLPENTRIATMDQPVWHQLPIDNIAPDSVRVTPEHMAYIIYTSGSTGKPKGVMVEHHNVLRLMAATEADYQFGADDVWTLFHSYAFDFSVWEIWGALLFGGRLVVVPHLISRAPDEFYQLLCDEQVTVLNQTPSAFHQLIAAQTDQPHHLRYVIFGGEALELSALAPWFTKEQNAQTQLVNMYGITETTVHTTYYPLTAEDMQRRGASPIGCGLNDLRLYILDAHRQPVPVGVAGELYVSGAGVARGYLNRPELTAERFLIDPFVADGHTRMYKSGDVGRWLADGTVEYLGRNDDQVKIRGFRIELGEIETGVRGFTGVTDAAVIAVKTVMGDHRLVAYYVGDAQRSALRDHVASLVPGYMVPSAWMKLDTLPLTSNGKLDRRALPEPDNDGVVRHEYQAPRGDLETLFARLWCELLCVEQVGRQDNFFELGGHSLLAVQFTARVGHQSDYAVSLAELFAHPQLADLASICQPQTEHQPVCPIMPRDDQTQAPLSLAQQRLWFLSQMDAKTSAAYVITSGVTICGKMNVIALQRALDQLYRRHAVLRTRFVSEQGQPYQVVDNAKVTFPLTIVHGIHQFAPEFDLEKGRVVAAQLVQLDPQRFELRLAMHHIVSDGWSMSIFIRELGTLYGAYARGEPATLTPLTINYGDFADWQQAHLVGDALDQQRRFWVEQLQSYPHFLELPTDYARPAKQDFSGASLPVTLDAALTAALNQLAQNHGCSLYMVLLASWSALMSRLARQEQVVIGTPIAGRTHEETEGLVGMFVNTQPMCVSLDNTLSTSALLAQVKTMALNAQANQDLPFERIVEAISPERNPSHSPIYQVMFALQNMPVSAIELEGLSMTMMNDPITTAQCDLSLLVSEQGTTINGQLNYATALFKAKTIQRIIGYWQQLLHGMVRDAQQLITRLPILSAPEFQQVVETPNQTRREFDRDRSLAQRFETWAEKTPDALAIIDGQTRLTYRGLNIRANRLAHHLVEQGVNQGDHVAVCIERSADLIVAELAIVKCGAVYVPMDPQAPEERLQFIINNSQACMLLVSQAQCQCLPDSDISRVLVTASVSANTTSDNLNVTMTGDTAAYIMYTSGSTGQPKGVVVPHRAISRLVINNGYLSFGVHDRVALAANPAFDATTMEIWGPLLNGGAVVVINQTLLLQPELLADELVAQGVTVMWLTVGLFNQYADALGKVFKQLRYLMVGGDVVDPNTVHKVLRDCAPEHLLNGYGPTETTTFALTHDIQLKDVADLNRPIPLGRPIGNTRVYLLDEHQNPVPQGVVGEIVIGGEGVALKYLGQPDLTRERFLRDPFSTQPGATMYRSGDLGCRRADGSIEFIGRNDFQVKIRGYRIELGEIEAAMQSLSAIDDAVVIAKGDRAENKRLLAYYTLAGDETLSGQDIKAELTRQLPSYMVPGAFIALAQIPLTPNGKVDRRALPSADDSALAHREFLPPKGLMEEQLAQIWQSLLDIEQVGREDNFFELGGHSLLAVQMIARVKAYTSVPLTITDLFDHPTLKALGARMAYRKLLAFKQQDLSSAAKKLFKGKVNG